MSAGTEHLVLAERRERGHDAVTPDLPCDDDTAGVHGRGSFDDTVALFYQDVPAELTAEAMRRVRRQSEAWMAEPSPDAVWPDVPTRVLLCRDDR